MELTWQQQQQQNSILLKAILSCWAVASNKIIFPPNKRLLITVKNKNENWYLILIWMLWGWYLILLRWRLVCLSPGRIMEWDFYVCRIAWLLLIICNFSFWCCCSTVQSHVISVLKAARARVQRWLWSQLLQPHRLVYANVYFPNFFKIPPELCTSKKVCACSAALIKRI